MSLINAVRNAVLTTFGGTPTLSRPHGIDFGRWRQWAEPDNPPKPLDFVIAGVTSGNHVNQMWEANRVTLADYRENGGIVGLYHFYEPVNALSQIKVFMECVEEINPQFVAVDFEELYKGQVLGASDAKILKELILALWEYYPRDKVMIYCGHDTWVVNVRKYDPAFFDQVELWLTWPNDAGENTVAFHPFYASKMGRRFEDVRIFQYSWDGDAPAYGIINGPLDLDLDVYVHAQPFDEWLGIEPEEPEEEITMETSEFYKIVAEHMERQ
ncbi:hypothetical protein KQH61_05940, partial [bacterium]|nr:hypothetical protein [bacterium]